MNERHAIMSYLAANKPAAMYQIFTTVMTDPPVERAESPDMEFWENVLVSFYICTYCLSILHPAESNRKFTVPQ